MNVINFEELCQREWVDTLHPYGDVVGLLLTNASRLELALDVLSASRDGAKTLFTGGAELAEIPVPVPVGARVNELVNPITRSVVGITDSISNDCAVVRYGPDREPRTVPV